MALPMDVDVDVEVDDNAESLDQTQQRQQQQQSSSDEPRPPTEREESVFKDELADQDDLFFFESEHLALKGNKDYLALMKRLVILEAMRVQAIKDLDFLEVEKAKALADPEGFIEKLKNGQLPEFPGLQTIPPMPEIDWSKYNAAPPDFSKPQTRQSNMPSTSKQNSDEKEEDKNKVLVRGRAYDESKPETFNKLWTVEEQKRLEGLLVKYPPEEVEMRRWTKIANELGNRTPKQVSSRVQKYFIKLAKTGLPIPGRGPKSKNETRKSSSKHKNYGLTRKSTFFPHEMDVPFVPETPRREPHNESQLAVGDYETKLSYTLQQMEMDKANGQHLFANLGYVCYVCGDEPMKGTRWHCQDCPDSVDLCGGCVVAQIKAEDPIHSPDHDLIALKPPVFSKLYDSDYHPQNFSTDSYNYLDPNYLPDD